MKVKYHQSETLSQVILIPETDLDRKRLNRLVAKAEQSPHLRIWWGDTDLPDNGGFGVKITA